MRTPIRNWRDAEQAAVVWMKEHGFDDAKLTAAGADGGIDVVAQAAVAQVKAQLIPVNVAEIQRIFGIAAAERKAALFFSLTGYRTSAVEWANRNGVALFTFNYESEIEPSSEVADQIVRAADTDDTKGEWPQATAVDELASRDDPRVREMRRVRAPRTLAGIAGSVLDPEETAEAVALAFVCMPTTRRDVSSWGLIVFGNDRMLFAQENPARVTEWPLGIPKVQHIERTRFRAAVTMVLGDGPPMVIASNNKGVDDVLEALAKAVPSVRDSLGSDDK